MKTQYLLLLVLIPATVAGYVIYNEIAECNVITREGCDTGLAPLCEKGSIHSEKDCACVADTFGCGGLDKEACEQNSNCFSFSRGGTCSCPSCEIYLSHQCLPKQ
jgi:hypothetical protein